MHCEGRTHWIRSRPWHSPSSLSYTIQVFNSWCRMITDTKKSCPGCIKLNKKPFAAFEADVPNVLKSVQPPFCYCQADIFGPVLAHHDGVQLKRWILVTLCLARRAVHLEVLHSYSSQSIIRGFRRTFAIRGTPRIIWIDSGLNIIKAAGISLTLKWRSSRISTSNLNPSNLG